MFAMKKVTEKNKINDDKMLFDNNSSHANAQAER